MADEGSDGHEPVLVTRDGAVLTLTLNRPERKNALTDEMIATITEVVERAGDDDTTRVIVLRGAGSDFCSGFDLAQSTSRERRAGREFRGGRPRTGHLQRGFQGGPHRMIEAFDRVQLPVVAGVRGWAAGIGNMLALSADVVVATPSANFWVPFVKKGFTPDSGNTWLLPRLVGIARAKEMILRGRPVNGETAATWGLVSECVPEEELDLALSTVTSELASAATLSVGLAKALIHRNLEVTLHAGLQNEGIYEELAVRSDDFKEGIRSFTEKRPPRYSGW